MPSEDVFKVTLFSHTTQRQFQNTHYFESGGVVTIDPFDEAVGLAEAFIADFLSLYRDVLSDETFIGCIKVEQVKGAGLPTLIEFFTNINGNRVGPPLPPNMVVIIRRRGVALGKARRSLLFLSGIRALDTNGSFLDLAFVTPALDALVAQYNDQLVASPSLNNAEYNPVMPFTQRVYATEVDVTIDTTLNTMSLIGGANWSGLGFITGGQFVIKGPNRNKGTYFATVVGGSPTITLTQNELEVSGGATLSAQQVIVPVDYITLQSAVQQLAIRQLNSRRSSHTGILA